MPRYTTTTVVVLAVIAFIVMFVSSGELVLSPLRDTWIEPVLLKLGKPNTIAFNLAVGYLVSTIFWLLVVYLPERSRRRLLRNNLSRAYRSFRESVLQILLWASVGTHDSRLPEQLCNHREFKEFFNSQRWDAAMNSLQSNELRLQELLLELQIFADELAYILSRVNIQDERAHRILKNLRENIYRLNHWNADTYDHVKSLGRFFWEVLSCSNFIDGQCEADVIQEMIDRL
jgi:hypothetical protein